MDYEVVVVGAPPAGLETASGSSRSRRAKSGDEKGSEPGANSVGAVMDRRLAECSPAGAARRRSTPVTGDEVR